MSATLESLTEFKEIIRANNHLAIEQPELRDKLLKLLDALISHLEMLLTIIPNVGTSKTKLDEGEIVGWTEWYVNAALPKLQEYVSPEALGNTSVPAGVILLCGGIGALLTGFSPLGFGTGSLVGKLIVGEIKSGVAADKLTDSFSDD